jgi:predicted transcriptional regulator
MPEDSPDDADDDRATARDRLEDGKERAVSGFDERVVDILAWLLDTETRARIFVYLRQHPWSTSDEVADGTGLYPSTVREALAELSNDDIVERRKRQAEGAGNNPYEYTAIPPSELVSGAVGRVQNELNTVFNLDARLDRDSASGDDDEDGGAPVRIEVEGGRTVEAEAGDHAAEVDADVNVEAQAGDGESGVDVDADVDAAVDDAEADVEGEVGVGRDSDEGDDDDT